MKPLDLYIDLGTANTLIYGKGRGFLLNEPSVLTIKHSVRGKNLFAIGHSAKSMLGKNPQNLAVVRPLHEGVIADFDATARMLHGFAAKIRHELSWLRPRMIISLPCRVTEHERIAVEEIGKSLGAGKVHLLHEPVAAAIGADLPVLNHRGSMIVDIGGGTTEIAVLSLGGIVTAEAVRIGGNDIDEAIIEGLRSQFNFMVGEQTAEKLKVHVASALPDKVDRSLTIGGLNLVSGLPSRLTVDANMLYPAVSKVVMEITLAIKKALAECPPEISGDVAETGIVLAGGGALMHGLDAVLNSELGVPIRIAENPLLSVANGGAKALENTKLFDALEHPA